MFKIARLLKRVCNIFDRSQVLIRLAVEKDLPLLHLSQDWHKSTCKQQWRGRSTVARLAADLGLPSKCLERSVKGLAAWALKSYLNLFVLMFGSFCIIFPSVSFPFWCFMGFFNYLWFFIYFSIFIICLKWGGLKPPQPSRVRRPWLYKW